MALDFKYRIHEVAKDFGMTSKDISQILTDYATTPKNHMQVLEDAELDLIFEYLTQHHQVGSIAEIFAPEPEEKKAPAKAPEEKKPDAPAQEKTAGSAPAGAAAAAAPVQQPQKPKPEKPAQPKQVVEKRVVDTRGSAGANLSKYDERFDKIAGNAGKDKDIRRGGKEKIQNKNKQRQQQVASAKRRQEERDKMQRLQFEVAKKQQLKVSIPDEINVGRARLPHEENGGRGHQAAHQARRDGVRVRCDRLRYRRARRHGAWLQGGARGRCDGRGPSH